MGYRYINLLKSLNNFVIPKPKIMSRIQANVDAFCEKYRLVLNNSLIVRGNIFCDFQALILHLNNQNYKKYQKMKKLKFRNTSSKKSENRGIQR
jgi:hypothetical protein